MRNLLLTLTYCGKNLHGWQIQDNALTVQEVFQEALYQIIHERPDIKGCSRTDSGVHANMYCVSMKIAHPITEDHLMMAMNRYLPDDVAVTDVRQVPDDFHARYSCKCKEYVYKVWNSRVRNPFLQDLALHYRYEMDVEALHREAQAFVGTHDFAPFAANPHRTLETTVRTIFSFEVRKSGPRLTMTVRGDGFLFVRALGGSGRAADGENGKLRPASAVVHGNRIGDIQRN